MVKAKARDLCFPVIEARDRDPTTGQPGVCLSCRSWCILNCFRTGQGCSLANLYKWALATSDLCACSQQETMNHTVDLSSDKVQRQQTTSTEDWLLPVLLHNLRRHNMATTAFTEQVKWLTLKSSDSADKAAASRHVSHTWTVVHQTTMTPVCHRDWDHRKIPHHSCLINCTHICIIHFPLILLSSVCLPWVITKFGRSPEGLPREYLCTVLEWYVLKVEMGRS